MNRKFLLNTYQINGYDDSDFMRVMWCEESQAVVEHMYGTTRGAYMSDPTEGTTPATDVTQRAARIYIEEQARIDHKKNPSISVGDWVRIVKGRKYDHGIEFSVQGFPKYHDRYGRVQTVYVEGGDYKTDIHNVELIEKGALPFSVLEKALLILTRY